MNLSKRVLSFTLALLCAITIVVWRVPAQTAATDPASDNAGTMLTEGKQTFRFETFGDEAFWGDALKLHQAIEGARFGGVGPGVSPKTALAVGLKVDSEALPSDLAEGHSQRTC